MCVDVRGPASLVGPQEDERRRQLKALGPVWGSREHISDERKRQQEVLQKSKVCEARPSVPWRSDVPSVFRRPLLGRVEGHQVLRAVNE